MCHVSLHSALASSQTSAEQCGTLTHRVLFDSAVSVAVVLTSVKIVCQQQHMLFTANASCRSHA